MVSSLLSAKGRIGRLTYLAWLFMLVVISGSLLFFFGMLIGEPDDGSATPPEIPLSLWAIWEVILIFTIYLYVIFTIKRLHDLNVKGWFSLLLFIPLINTIFQLYLFIAKPENHHNTFAKPRKTKMWEKIFGYLHLLTAVILVIYFVQSTFFKKYDSYTDKYSQLNTQLSETATKQV